MSVRSATLAGSNMIVPGAAVPPGPRRDRPRRIVVRITAAA